jgi:alanine racemase
MNRLGLEPDEWAAVSELALSKNPTLVMSHLACADEPDHPINRQQLQSFIQMTDWISDPRTLAATRGVLLGPEFHFDLTRPGIGLYGGAPFLQATPTIELDLPIIQVRDVKVGEAVGYGNKWLAERPSRIATVSCGYADGVMRCLSFKALLYHGAQPCKLVGRISMDLITVDITDLTGETPEKLNLIGPHQTVDDLATSAQTIGYEVLTQLGGRYSRLVNGGK